MSRPTSKTAAALACSLIVTASAFVTAPSLAAQHTGHAAASAGPDEAAVTAVIQAYHDALAASDSSAALALLADDALILESGSLETRDEYRSHHLPGDMAFAAAVARERGPMHVTVDGDVAWAVSTSTTNGTYREREIASRGAELMVLTRTPDGWRIRAIHWSSRAQR